MDRQRRMQILQEVYNKVFEGETTRFI